MPTFNTYQAPVGETPIARKWFVRALIASLAIHAGLYVTFRYTKLDHFTPVTDRLVPRTFTSLGRVEVDEKLLADDKEESKSADPKQSPQAAPIEIPKDAPSADNPPTDAVFTPTAPEMVKPIVTENPKVTDTDIKTLTKLQQNVNKDLDNELNAVSEQLLKDKSLSKPLLKMPDSNKTGGTGNTVGGEAAIPGTKSLDDALSGTGGGLQNGDKIGIKGGALFEYNKADLMGGALGRLQQLGELVKRHPNATLIIEGYADSIGDPAYNISLSQKRAEAVKTWLTQNMGIEDGRIEAVGRGSTKFIDTPTYDATKQDLEPNNRRVEIQFRFPN